MGGIIRDILVESTVLNGSVIGGVDGSDHSGGEWARGKMKYDRGYAACMSTRKRQVRLKFSSALGAHFCSWTDFVVTRSVISLGEISGLSNRNEKGANMRAIFTLLTGFALWFCALAAPAYAAEVQLKGVQFINTVSRATMSGETADGVKFNAYFLKGGIVTYMDMTGLQDRGTWHMDKKHNVCITWQKFNEGKEECFLVTFDGAEEGAIIRWKGKTAGSAMLRGTVTSSFVD